MKQLPWVSTKVYIVYRDKNEQKSWESICYTLYAGYVYDIKGITAKVKSLRETYKRELQKVEESQGTGTDTDSVYCPTLAWFNDADFWRPHVLTRATRDTMVPHFTYSEYV
jgi:hypothetical protein